MIGPVTETMGRVLPGAGSVLPLAGAAGSGHGGQPTDKEPVQNPEQPHTPLWRTRGGIVLCGFLLVAGFYLMKEHTAHVFTALPFLLLLSCPLTHLFMHHGHSGHSGHQGRHGDGRGVGRDDTR